MLQAILATEYEKAIIDKLRNDDSYCFRSVACNMLGLPYTPEALEYRMHAIEHGGYLCGESDIEIEQKKKECKQEQTNRIKKYHAEGYEGDPEFGNGSVDTFLKMIK